MQIPSASAATPLVANTATGSPTAEQKRVTQDNTRSDGPVVVVTLSPEAQSFLAGATISNTSAADGTKAVTDLLSSSGDAIYSTAISSLKTYPVDLNTRYNELVKKPNPTADEKAEALKLNQESNAREEKAFFHFAHEANAASTSSERSHLMGQYYKAYVEFLDTLSPAEQASPRYAGTRPSAVSDYTSWSNEAGDATSDISGSQDPIMMLFDKIKKQHFNVDDKAAKDVLQSYKDGVAGLSSSQADPGINDSKVAEASSRFSAVQSVADQARTGDGTALAQLQSLADDPSSLSTFLTYAQSLSPGKTA